MRTLKELREAMEKSMEKTKEVEEYFKAREAVALAEKIGVIDEIREGLGYMEAQTWSALSIGERVKLRRTGLEVIEAMKGVKRTTMHQIATK